jgi:hypothetical protein
MSILPTLLLLAPLVGADVPAGRYGVEDATAAGVTVEAAVADAVSGLGFFVRPFAAGTLREANAVADELALEVEPVAGRERIHVRFGGVDVTTLAGEAVERVVDSHGTALVRQWREGDVIVQTASRKEGIRTIRFVPAAGAALDVVVRFETPELPRPLTYRLRYRRR